jgi:NAD(P)-dependent dehydrogenase (short-subunit alcohol dehydrogenase family)
MPVAKTGLAVDIAVNAGAETQRRVAVVTGAGSGVGAAVAVALAGAGYATVLAGRRIEALDSTRARIESAGGTALSVMTDVTDAASVKALFAQTAAHFGRIDVLFNNAGVNVAPVLPDELSPDDWDRVIATNVTGIFLCVREAFALMRSQPEPGGRIINNGSLSAHVPRPRSLAYTASKHAVTGITRAVALDGRAHNIACGQIDIGNAATDLTATMTDGALQPDGSIRSEPLMPVDAVARGVLYMAGLPLDVNVLHLTVMATGMPYVGRG